MSLSQFEFWSLLEAELRDMSRKALSQMDNAPDYAVVRDLLATRRTIRDVRQKAVEIYARMTGTETPPPPAADAVDDDDFPY